MMRAKQFRVFTLAHIFNVVGCLRLMLLLLDCVEMDEAVSEQG